MIGTTRDEKSRRFRTRLATSRRAPDPPSLHSGDCFLRMDSAGGASSTPTQTIITVAGSSYDLDLWERGTSSLQVSWDGGS